MKISQAILVGCNKFLWSGGGYIQKSRFCSTKGQRFVYSFWWKCPLKCPFKVVLSYTVSVCWEYEFKNCLAFRPGLGGQDVWAILLEGVCFAHLDGRRWLAGLAGREKLLLLGAGDNSWLTWRGTNFNLSIFVHKWSILAFYLPICYVFNWQVRGNRKESSVREGRENGNREHYSSEQGS